MKEQRKVTIGAISLADEKPIERLFRALSLDAAGLCGECQRQRLLPPVFVMNDSVAGKNRPGANLTRREIQNRACREAFDFAACIAQEDHVVLLRQVGAKDRLAGGLEVG